MAGNSKNLPIGLSRTNHSKVQKPTATKKFPSKNKGGSDRKPPTSIFGPHAVTRYLRIPQTGNITGVELTVFLPELLRTPGVLFRFFQNGADAQALARISTWFRATIKDHHTPTTAANAMRHITQPTMRSHLKDEHWTETRQKAGWYDTPGQNWDHDNLTFAGVQNYCEDNPKDGRHKRLLISDVRFASLAVDVVIFPSGDDELDLTRCVKAAAANEDLPLMFPRDYGYLTRLLGGPRTVNPAHRDRELFDRWRQVSWAETPSERQVNAAWNITHYKFTAAQKAATEHYLQQSASTEQLALDAIHSPMDMLSYTQHGSYVPSANDSQLPWYCGDAEQLETTKTSTTLNDLDETIVSNESYRKYKNDNQLSVDSPLPGQSMHDSAVDLVRTLAGMSEDEMDVVYYKWLVAHGAVCPGSLRATTSTSDVVRRYLESDRSLHGPLSPITNEAVVMVPSSDALNNNLLADSYGSWSSSPMNWHLGYRSSSAVPVDISQIDPEILKTSSPEMTGSIARGYGRKSPQVGSEDSDFDPPDGVENAFALKLL